MPGCFDGDISQCLSDVAHAPGQLFTSVAGDAWTAICKSFSDACTAVLQAFARAFAAFPRPDLASISASYSVSLTIGMTVALILLLIQVGATAWTQQGAPLANAGIGLFKAALASLATLMVANEALKASDEITNWIITANRQSVGSFSGRLTTLLAWNPLDAPVVLLLCGLVGLLLTLVLWAELLLRNTALAVLVATAPIAAAGQVGVSTQDWWKRLVRSALQLVILKPVIALVFAIGFPMAGHASGITGLMSGLLVLVLAVFAWPAIGRFFTFTTVAMGGGMGLAALAGAGANRGTGGGSPIDPGAFGSFSEGRSMAAAASRMPADGTAAAAAKAAGGAALGVGGIATSGMQAMQKTLNTLVSRMEQMAGHGGMDGANPTAYPAGFPSGAGSRRGGSSWSGPPPQISDEPPRSAPANPPPPLPDVTARRHPTEER
jgi:hypothetical protein